MYGADCVVPRSPQETFGPTHNILIRTRKAGYSSAEQKINAVVLSHGRNKTTESQKSKDGHMTLRRGLVNLTPPGISSVIIFSTYFYLL